MTTNSDTLIQEVAQILYRYYKDRGKGLERYTKEIIQYILKNKSKGIGECSNLHRLDKIGLDMTPYEKGDILLANQSDHLYVYYIAPNIPYSQGVLYLNRCSWTPDDIFSSISLSTEFLIDNSKDVYLVRKR